MEHQLTLATEDGRSSGLAVSPGSRLLAPLRDAVERAQESARPLVAPIADGEAYCWTLDFVADQIEKLDRIEEATHDTQRALVDAVNERNGYDTWPADQLEAHIRKITALRDAMDRLSAAVRALRTAERAAFHDFANIAISNGVSDSQRQDGAK
jgi:hypothetical protein